MYNYWNFSYQYRSHLQHNTPHASLFEELKSTTNDPRPKTINYYFRKIWKKQKQKKAKAKHLLVE